jgi:branched-chain amino acid transport system substrate-binding protein
MTRLVVRPALAMGVLAACAALLGPTACARAGIGSGTPGDTAFVGVAVGLQSPERYVNVYRGAQLALDELNARRPPDAPVLALRRGPDGVASHVELAAAFVADAGVVGVVGHTESDPTIDASAIYEDRQGGGRRALVAVSPTANGTLVTRTNDWVFRVCPVVTRQAEALARYASDSLRLRRMAIVYRNDASGKDFAGAFAAEFARAGGAIVERDPFVEEFPEFEAFAIRMTRRATQGVVIAGNAPEARRMIRALRSAGGRQAILTTNPPAGGDTAAGREFAGVHYASLFAPQVASRLAVDSAAVRFTRDFARATGAAPDHWGALAYDAAMLVGRAIHAVGPDRRLVRDWIADTGRELPPHEGVTGRIAFDAVGDPIAKRVLVREGAP